MRDVQALRRCDIEAASPTIPALAQGRNPLERKDILKVASGSAVAVVAGQGAVAPGSPVQANGRRKGIGVKDIALTSANRFIPDRFKGKPLIVTGRARLAAQPARAAPLRRCRGAAAVPDGAEANAPERGQAKKRGARGAPFSCRRLSRLRRSEAIRRARGGCPKRSNPGAKRSRSSGYCEHLQRRAGRFGQSQRACRTASHPLRPACGTRARGCRSRSCRRPARTAAP